jgi:saccharopine dehydrogenase-like NADP-dependent oxidoreductase
MRDGGPLRVAVLGAGRIGLAVAFLLSRFDHFEVCIGDCDPSLLGVAADLCGIRSRVVDASEPGELAAFLDGRHAVVSACSFDVNPTIADVALQMGVSYFDLTEDVNCTRAIVRIAEKARPGQVFVPQCGLAPGFINLLGYDLARQFDDLDTLTLCVGALPLHPHNRLKYNLTWSTRGVVNEYCMPCEVILGGRRATVPPMTDVEALVLDGIEYEAFHTSGGLGTLADTLEGKVKSLRYKTIRYPGHAALVSFLLDDLGFSSRRDELVAILDRAIPATTQDLVWICGTAIGRQHGRLVVASDLRRVDHGELFGRSWTAIQLATAAGVAGVVDLYGRGDLKGRGAIRQEQIPLNAFLATEFGRVYSTASAQELRT